MPSTRYSYLLCDGNNKPIAIFSRMNLAVNYAVSEVDRWYTDNNFIVDYLPEKETGRPTEAMIIRRRTYDTIFTIKRYQLNATEAN